ncbi:M28 family peptidase [Cloacibacterium sp.]|uniref:M28 family peptidase n=1 Tax=Cloacibacterium sp. TaxID=1913682 RepID=UPI0039E4878B
MKKTLLLLAVTAISLFNAQANATYLSRVNLVQQTNIENYNAALVGFGVRSTGSTASTNALNYIVQKYKDFGYTDSQITYDNFTYSSNTVQNIIITKTGTVYPDQYVIICGHYDSHPNNSVGANDNGSGVAAIMEVARILKNVPTEYSIKFIHFTGEEQNLLGSKNYVSNVVKTTSMKIKLVLNLDQIGGRSDRTNNTIVCEADNYNNTTQGIQSTNDAASLTATNSLKDYVGYYSTLTGVLNYAYGSDYMPFENNGEIITGLYERPTNSSGTVVTNPYYHNNTDTIAHLSYPYIFQVTKAALGAMQHFAVASTSTLAVSDIEKTKDFELYPNPAKEILNLHLDDSIKDFSFEISDSNGRVISITKNQKQINTSQLKPGVYFGTLSSEKGKTSKKFIIK